MIKIVSPTNLSIKRDYGQVTQKQQHVVKSIIADVKQEGDTALYRFTQQFDQVMLDSMKVTEEEIKVALSQVDSSFIEAIKKAADRIRHYHEKQKQQSWFDSHTDGTILGQIVRPLERVGVYIPGGRAAYPSTVLMNIVPAQVAGVENLIMVSPPQADGTIYAPTLVAAHILQVENIYKVGGAQAIAALAYGTDIIPAVDKIVGPGNIFVTLAKQAVYGQVDIDSVAGPSEVVVVADQTAKPAYIAADLLSQAEHDPMASAILITPSEQLAKQVSIELNQQLQQLSRKEIAAASLRDFGAICVAKDISEAISLSNQLAPEHLQLMVEDPWDWLPKVKHAGAIFLGEHSPESVGDYFAGPSHVLPTNGTARFFSPLSVDSFIKKMSLISYSEEAYMRDANNIITLAQKEGLDAHATSIRIRMKEDKGDDSSS